MLATLSQSTPPADLSATTGASPLFWLALGAVWALVMVLAVSEARRDRALAQRQRTARSQWGRR